MFQAPTDSGDQVMELADESFDLIGVF